MTRPALLLSLLLPSLAAGADLTAAQLFSSGRVLDHDSVILATHNAHDADMCRGFSLTDSQIKDFFHKATPLTADQLHRQYQWSPCEVEGHILYQDQKVAFVISAASTGEIEVTPGSYLQFGCAVCKDLFDFGYLTPAPAAATTPQ